MKQTNLCLQRSIALGALFGAFGATQSAVCNFDFYDTRDDELVVNYLKKIKGGLGSDSRFNNPYEKGY